MDKHHKEAFEKIPEEKRQRIFDAAIAEFGNKGFTGANINIIARQADISIGSMYNYFDSKEQLFLAVIDYGYDLLETILSGVDLESGDIFDKFENLLRVAQTFSRKNPELNQIYLDLASEGLRHLSARLSRTVESITAEYYRALLAEARKEGLVADDIDDHVTAFCLDNIILLLQFSYSSEYFRERMKIFAGADAVEDDEKMIKGIMRFIRGALSPLLPAPGYGAGT
ncbi:MAG: TetR/AcrR family transcriptional regulator [Deltaproteobacteria bacterium]|nr:TetR/AcrR family transcriptional regulator [Deltaproteobacteria bacterium]